MLNKGAFAYQSNTKTVSYTHLDVYKRQLEKHILHNGNQLQELPAKFPFLKISTSFFEVGVYFGKFTKN